MKTPPISREEFALRCRSFWGEAGGDPSLPSEEDYADALERLNGFIREVLVPFVPEAESYLAALVEDLSGEDL